MRAALRVLVAAVAAVPVAFAGTFLLLPVVPSQSEWSHALRTSETAGIRDAGKRTRVLR